MKRIAVMLLVAAVFAGTANADILLFSGARYDVSITDPVAVGDGSEGLVSFVLKFTNTTGDAGYDAGSVDGVYFGYTGISSQLHQETSPALSPTSPTADNTFATVIDTHFMDIAGDMLVVSPATEDTDVLVSSEAPAVAPPFDAFSHTSFGSNLTGVFAVDAAPVFDLAQVVVPASIITGYDVMPTGWIHVDLFVSGTKGGEAFNFWLDVPEPATMSLLAIGGLAALIRRRK